MIELADYAIFQAHKNSLHELSKDDSDYNNIVYMTDSKIAAVDFDAVKREYANELGLSEEVAASADALLDAADGIAFIEFKNGKVNNRNVKDKVRDSLLIFCDIVQKELSYTRENVDFILVYNLTKNPMPNQLNKNAVQESLSRTEIAQHFLQKESRSLSDLI